MTERTIAGAAAYRPRPIRFLALQQTAGWRLKVYGITARGEHPRTRLVEAARVLAPTVLPSPAVHEGGADPYDLERYGVGFVILHDAADYAFALYHWWAGRNEIHQRVFSALHSRLPELHPHPTPAIGCVWDLAITDFERRSWLRHMLAGEAAPDLEAYLEDRFEDDV